GLFLRMVYNLSRVDVGFDADNVLVFRINPSVPAESPSRALDMYERLVSAMESVPGIQSVTLSAIPLLGGGEWELPVRPDGTGDQSDAFVQVVRFNFFHTMGIPLRAGRTMSPADAEGRP